MNAGEYLHATSAVEPAEALERNLHIGGQLWAAAQAFFFLPFFFAFFYLRELDTNGMWRPHDVTPPVRLGTAVFACVLAAVGAYAAAALLARGQRGSAWPAGAVVSFLLVLAALVLQGFEYSRLDFGPASGAYASVFVAWTGWFAVTLIGAAYWLGTACAQSFRARRGRPGADESEITRAMALVHPSLESLGIVLYVLGAVQIALYVLLYLVR